MQELLMQELGLQVPKESSQGFSPSQDDSSTPLESVGSFLEKLSQAEGSAAGSPTGDGANMTAPESPSMLDYCGILPGSAKWLDRPDLLGLSRSEPHVTAKLRSLPSLDLNWLEMGLTRL
jgi:hypothetical protein